MQIEIGAEYVLVDALGHELGKVRITGPEGNFICGKIDKYPDYSLYDEIFKEQEECVNRQQFRALEEIDARISKLGVRLFLIANKAATPFSIIDLQIMNADDICFQVANDF